jgi:hypothetical protein
MEGLSVDTDPHDCPVPIVILSTPTIAAGHPLTVTVANMQGSTVFLLSVQRMSLSPLVSIQETASPLGDLQVQLTIPANAPPAQYSVNAAYVCEGKHVGGRTPLTIQTFSLDDDDPQTEKEQSLPVNAIECAEILLEPSSTSVKAGTVLDVSLSHLNASANYTLLIIKRGFSPLITLRGKADFHGRASLSVTIPLAARSGDYVISVWSLCHSQSVLSVTRLHIDAVSHLKDCPIPELEINESSAVAGGAVLAQARSYLPSTNYTLRVGKRGLSPLVNLPGVTDANGCFQVTIPLPAAAPAGNYTVSASSLCDGHPLVAHQPLVIVMKSDRKRPIAVM